MPSRRFLSPTLVVGPPTANSEYTYVSSNRFFSTVGGGPSCLISTEINCNSGFTLARFADTCRNRPIADLEFQTYTLKFGIQRATIWDYCYARRWSSCGLNYQNCHYGEAYPNLPLKCRRRFVLILYADTILYILEQLLQNYHHDRSNWVSSWVCINLSYNINYLI